MLPLAKNSEKAGDAKQKSQDALRQRSRLPKTARRSSIPKGILRTLHSPPLPRARNNALIPRRILGTLRRCHEFQTRSQDTPRASAATRTNNEQTEFSGCSTHQTLKIRAALHERCDTHHPRRRFAGDLENSHGAKARAFRHARSPQRVRRRT